ncbi:hypothetical protein LS68_001980 [Helicobacter sp. MIT 05-5293]|uniref:hypothetical protein n=1 Tax=Helicobacter sp. MIT 05-5293 TaxID=1548149 RepID=UPI00051D9FCE|nr:hypothetical protein [Helicobacter sp. MIT 05-5293]TLD81816.1 hypothetical protein LS68_001980 [Helicobacter sp. MIT 05-5293]
MKQNILPLQSKDYEILNEANEIALDFTAFDLNRSVFVAPTLAVIGNGQLCEDFLNFCTKQNSCKLSITHLLPQDFVRLSGHLGDFKIYFKDTSHRIDTLCIAQVVSFAHLENLSAYKGIHLANAYSDAASMFQAVVDFIGEYAYRQNIIFNPSVCQYQDRRPLENGEGFCHYCVDVCPTMGIAKDDTTMLLSTSPIDCIGCGKCVCVCPTGSVQKEGDTLESFTYRARLYKDRIPLVVSSSQWANEENLPIFNTLLSSQPLALPFVIDVPNMLNETYLLTLIQESGAPVVIFGEIDELVMECVESLNVICEKIFGRKGVIFGDSLKDIDSLMLMPHWHYLYTPNAKEGVKDIFSARLQSWVKQESFGSVSMKGFGEVKVDASKCTLCLSCVEACNTHALINQTSSFELLFKASLCTDCGYCVPTCAENVITLESRTFDLSPVSFEYVSKAQDKPFRCVECNKIFATHKSIEKIKAILSPAFQSNPSKLRSLECCADCKVKVMFEVAK